MTIDPCGPGCAWCDAHPDQGHPIHVPFAKEGAFTWRAQCSCGWTGDVWTMEQQAIDQANEHARPRDDYPEDTPMALDAEAWEDE